MATVHFALGTVLVMISINILFGQSRQDKLDKLECLLSVLAAAA